METLEIGSGQTPQDWEHEQKLRREELRGDVRMAANFFFIAAGGALISSGLLPIRFTLFVDVGYIELAYLLMPRSQPHAINLAALFWVSAVSLGIIGSLVLLGFAGRAMKRWAFWAGLVIYGIDSLVLIFMFSFLSIGVHGFFLWKWWQAQRDIKTIAGIGRSPGSP